MAVYQEMQQFSEAIHKKEYAQKQVCKSCW